MAENILQNFKARNEYIEYLRRDITKNDAILEEAKKQNDELKERIIDLKSLGKYPEHTALIPLGKNIYMKGKIVHTGECYVKKNASPESYIVLKSLEQALKGLEDEIKQKEKDLENIEYANCQLIERKRLLIGGEEEEKIVEDEDLPKEIKSDKGVAVKVGEFYEIVEFEED